MELIVSILSKFTCVLRLCIQFSFSPLSCSAKVVEHLEFTHVTINIFFLGTKKLSGRSANSFARNHIKTSSVSFVVFVDDFVNVCNGSTLLICIRMGSLVRILLWLITE